MPTKKTTVTMIHSVGDLPGGTKQKLDPQTADEFIVKGYAKGKLSRRYTEEEKASLTGPTQVVRMQ